MAAMETKPSSSNEEIQPSNPQSTLSIDSSEQVITPQLSAQEGSETNVLDSSVKRKREEEDEDEEENPSGGGGGGEVESSSNPNPLWKTSLCSYFRRQESCSHGDACRYAHGEAELRPRPDNSWDPTSERAKHLSMMAVIDPPVEDPPLDDNVLDKCLIGLPRNWVSEKLKSHLNDLGIAYETAKKKKGMTVGFVGFANAEQVKSAIEVLNEKTSCGKHIKVADAIRRFHEKNPMTGICCDERIGQPTENHSGSEDSAPISSSLIVDDDVVDKDRSLVEGMVSKIKSVRDVVTPLAHMPYSDQLEHKKNSLLQTLKRLTRSARKACPHAVSLPEWILKSRDIGGLPCKWEGILSSPIIDGYRNKCEFSVGYSLQGKRTVGFMLGNFREGMTAVEEPVNCPNVSRISCKFALIFQDFLQSSVLPSWNRINNTGFWRQLTVREGRNPGQVDAAENLEAQIAEVMLIIQVCSLDVDEGLIKSEFERMTLALAQGASACSPPLPLTTIFVQDHQGISNVAPADCPLHSLLVPNVGRPCSEKPDVAEARIHDYISNLRFCISPTAFFQVNTLAAEKLYSLAGDWADLSPDTLLFDICCGTGSIGLTLAHRVGMVVGIEMNDSAVSDACRNAEINGIKNCRFVCGKAENVMGALLKEYLNVPQQHDIASNVSVGNHKDNDESEVNNICDKKMLHPIACTSAEVLATNDTAEEMPSCSEDKSSCSFDVLGRPEQHFSGKTSHGEGSIDHNETIGCSGSLASQENHVSEENKGAKAAPLCQFKDVVAIVDPPRAGLHPIVIKALRTHPRIRRLVYISCNPESLVANAIELCTPTADKPEKGNNSRGWRKMGSNGLARQRVKSMPNSEPFKPVKAMAVDMFPHTVHCEMVMLLESQYSVRELQEEPQTLSHLYQEVNKYVKLEDAYIQVKGCKTVKVKAADPQQSETRPKRKRKRDNSGSNPEGNQPAPGNHPALELPVTGNQPVTGNPTAENQLVVKTPPANPRRRANSERIFTDLTIPPDKILEQIKNESYLSWPAQIGPDIYGTRDQNKYYEYHRATGTTHAGAKPFNTKSRISLKRDISSRYIIGFNGEAMQLEGEIPLTVEAGPVKRLVEFAVIDTVAPYNTIMGRSWLHQLGAVASTFHQVLRFPTSQGIVEIRGDQVATLECNAIVLKAKQAKTAKL